MTRCGVCTRACFQCSAVLASLVLVGLGTAAAQGSPTASFSSLLHAQQTAAIESYAFRDQHSRACGVSPPNSTLLAAAQTETAKKAEDLKQQVKAEASALISINVYAHVISEGPALTQGNVPDAWVAAQVAAMNKAYIATGFQFALVNISRTINAEWYSMAPSSSTEVTAKSKLRKGNYRDLNLYTSSGGASGLLGWSYYAFERLTNIDGVSVYWNAMPGGTAYGGAYGLGMSAVHETGHWLGLLHTFQGGCASPGDYVTDTAAEASPSFGCTARDSCPGDGLADPINNYMNYSPDSCMNTFTPGQSARMMIMWQTYRGIFPVLPTGTKLVPSTVPSVGTSPPPPRSSPKPSVWGPTPKPASSGRTPPPPKAASPPLQLKPTPLKPAPPPAQLKPTPLKAAPSPAPMKPAPLKPAPSPAPMKPAPLKAALPPVMIARRPPPPVAKAAVIAVKVARFAQCGGIAGSPVCEPTCLDGAWPGVGCVSGSCKRSNQWYWLCL